MVSSSITLRFAETFFGTDNPPNGGDRCWVFDVFCNGRSLQRHFDILKEAGGDNRALVKAFTGIEPNSQGKILLQFVPVKDYACLNSSRLSSSLYKPGLTKRENVCALIAAFVGMPAAGLRRIALNKRLSA